MERTLFEIQTQIGQLCTGNQELPNSHSRQELSKKIQVRLTQASGELYALVRKLDDNKGNPITRDELERRQRKVEQLQSQHFLLNKDFSGNQATIASSIIRSPVASLWGDYDETARQSSSSARIDDRPEDRQLPREEIIRSQDESLENLSKILSRQKNIALKISQEVNEQDEILDDIALQMENTDGRINNGTQLLSRLHRRTNRSLCGSLSWACLLQY